MDMTPQELQKRLEKARDFRLVDVREPDEWVVARLPGAELIPLGELERQAPEKLSPDETIVVYCHHGMRSARAQDFLKAKGYTHVWNLTGGIDAWSLQIDPGVARY
jgi:adenylyltransferase/sulfurtransferase